MLGKKSAYISSRQAKLIQQSLHFHKGGTELSIVENSIAFWKEATTCKEHVVFLNANPF